MLDDTSRAWSLLHSAILIRSNCSNCNCTQDGTFIYPRHIQKEEIVLEKSARFNPDPNIIRERRNVLKEKKIFGGGKEEIR